MNLKNRKPCINQGGLRKMNIYDYFSFHFAIDPTHTEINIRSVVIWDRT